MPNEALVPVLVPESLLPTVRPLIAAHMGLDGEPIPNSAATAHPTASTRVEQWSQDICDRLVRDASPRRRAILRLLADRADEWVPTSALIKVASPRPGKDPASTIRGAFGAIGRLVTHRYTEKFGVTMLPWESRWDHEKGHQSHRMPKAIASRMLSALNTHGGS